MLLDRRGIMSRGHQEEMIVMIAMATTVVVVEGEDMATTVVVDMVMEEVGVDMEEVVGVDIKKYKTTRERETRSNHCVMS